MKPRLALCSALGLLLSLCSAGAGTFTVTNTADTGAGSLRQALADAAAAPGPDVINFAPAFNGEAADTITLTSTELTIADTGGLTIDATGNAGGVTISGNNARRIFNVSAGAVISLHGLTLTGGQGGASSGGAITSLGSVALSQCLLFGNASQDGAGAIAMAGSGTLTASNCTFTGNTAKYGGAVVTFASSVTTLNHCTFTGNRATDSSSSNGGGGAIDFYLGTLTMTGCLLAGNTSASINGPELWKESTGNFNASNCLIGDGDDSGLTNGTAGNMVGTAPAILNALLGPLSNNAGPTLTMMPLPGSPALDRLASSTLTTDQRGLPRVMWGKADIGAVEAGVSADCAWEVREISRTPATPLNSLADADALVADVMAKTVHSTPQVINLADPQSNPAGGGFFPGDVPFASNTAADDDDFVTVGRTFISIPDAAPVRATGIRVTTLNPGGELNFHLAEIQVFQVATGTNVAAGGTASGAAGFGSVPADVNDGNTDGSFGNGSVWHSPGAAPGESITVTFSAAADIESFRLWGRGDCCQERDDLLRVELLDGATVVSSQVMGILNGTDVTGSGRARDYTFGFSSDDGARLRIFRADGGLPPLFSSSTRLNPANPANPAHSGNALSYTGFTPSSDTLGVIALAPGTYGVEFLAWERGGGAHAEVFAAIGAKTAVDGSFSLIGDTAGNDPGISAPGSQLTDETFTASNGGYTVADTNGPFAGPWTYNAAAGTWSTAGQNVELGRAPSTALTSPVLTMTRAGEVRVQFTHRHNFEDESWDGGQLQMSINGGAFTAVSGTAFTSGGYNGTVLGNSNSALKGQPAFVGTSAGYATPGFITSTASLGSLFEGDTVQLRFLAAFDTNTSPAPAWEITGVTVDQTSGWDVAVIRSGANSLAAAVTQVDAYWCHPPQVTGLRFTSANDQAARDPMTFTLEGTLGTAAAGPWVPVASGNTGLSTNRLTAAPAVTFSNRTAYRSYRLLFPTVRDEGAANSMQIGEVAFLNAFGEDVTAPGDPLLPSSLNSPANEMVARAIDNDIGTKYLNFDKLNAGFTVTPSLGTSGNVTTGLFAAINFTDPQAGGGGHGQAQASFPGDTAADDDNFALGARTTITVTEPGDFTFCLLGDDSVRLRIRGSRNWTISGGAGPVALYDGFQTNSCCADAFGTVALAAGSYQVELIYNEIGGLAYLGAWVAQGHPAAFTPVLFRPLGEPAAGSGSIFTSVRQSGLPVRPFNDDFAAAATLHGSEAHAVSCNDGATMETDEQASGDGSKSVWWNWTAPAAGIVQVDTIGSSFDTILAVLTGASVNALTEVASDDDGGVERTSLLTFTAVAGTVYRIQITSYDGESGTIRLNLGAPATPPVIPVPGNDNFATPAMLTGPSAFATGDNTNATAETGEPSHRPAGGAATRSVWFAWTAPAAGDYVIDTSGSTFDTVLSVYTGAALNTLTRLASNDDLGGGSRQSRLVLTARAGVTYRIAVDGLNASRRGRFVLSIVPMPAILSHSVRNGVGGSRIFNLRWRSEPGVNYQVQSSTDLTTWRPVTTCTASEGVETDLDIESIPATTGRLYFRVSRQ